MIDSLVDAGHRHGNLEAEHGIDAVLDARLDLLAPAPAGNKAHPRV
mgnify:CR=1 FL=1